MTGEMHQSEVTEENFPIHFAIAKGLGGTVHAFDQFQGPYIRTPKGKLWLIVEGEGPGFRIYNQTNDRTSGVIYQSEKKLILQYAREVLNGKRLNKFQFDVIETREYRCTYTVQAETLEEAREKAKDGNTIEESDSDMISILEVRIDKEREVK